MMHYINEYHAFPGLKKSIRHKEMLIDEEYITSLCKRYDVRFTGLIVPGLKEFTTYDLIIFLFYNCRQIGGKNAEYVANYLYAFDMIRVAYHLKYHKSQKTFPLSLQEKTNNLYSDLLKYSKSLITNVTEVRNIDQLYDAMIMTFDKYSVEFGTNYSVYELWTEKKWKDYVDLYPDAVIMKSACELLCYDYEKTDFWIEIGKSVSHAIIELFLSIEEVNRWPQKFKQKACSPISSYIISTFSGKVQYSEIVYSVYHSQLMSMLIEKIKNSIYYIENCYNALGIKKHQSDMLVYRGKITLMRYNEMVKKTENS